MARSAAERLALFESIRDKVEGALASGAPVVSYTVDGQMVQKEGRMQQQQQEEEEEAEEEQGAEGEGGGVEEEGGRESAAAAAEAAAPGFTCPAALLQPPDQRL